MSLHVSRLPIAVDPLIEEANRRERRRRLLLAGALAGAGVLALAATFALPPGGPKAPGAVGGPSSSDSGGASQAEARVRADSILRKIVLPPGAKRVSAGMAGAAGAAPNYGTDVFTQYAYRHAFWRIPKPLASVMAFLKLHSPRDFAFPVSEGAQLVLSAGRSAGGHEPSRIFAYAVPSHRATILRVDAGVPWTVPRLPSTLVPAAAVREIDIHSPFAPKRPTHRVVNPREVALITRWFNDLNVLQPNTTVLCADMAPAWLHFTFRSGSGAALASALVPPGPASSCTEIGFSLNGRRQTPLIDSTPENRLDFIDRVQRLLGGVLFGPHRRPY